MKSFPYKPTDNEIASAVGSDYFRTIAIREKNSKPIDKKIKEKIFRDICEQYMIHRPDYTSVDQLIYDIEYVWNNKRQQKVKEEKAKAKKPRQSDQYKIKFPAQ